MTRSTPSTALNSRDLNHSGVTRPDGADAWFGPGTAPPVTARPVPIGRQFDYPVGWNLRIEPRQDEAIGFAELRALADSWDLLRLVIETRKDQLEALEWRIKPRSGLAFDDPRIVRLTRFLARPDGEHGWGPWCRMLLEDLFVIDAPTLYLRRDRADRLIGLEPIDGATIKRVLGDDGRTPAPPDPAYQQVLKGVPAVDYTADELIYAPRNPRAHRVYGLSPVEQIVLTVNVALRRQLSQLAYYTEGNTPDALVSVPPAWSAEQIRQYQEWWDSVMEGNPGTRRQTRFVPGALHYMPTRDVLLKDDFDEWLARVVCFAFSIPPTALVRQINRATAETAENTALAEGLQPLMGWLKGLIDRVISDVIGWDDLEFAWADQGSVDPQIQAEIDVAYVAAGIKTRDEVRAQLGLPPLSQSSTPEGL